MATYSITANEEVRLVKEAQGQFVPVYEGSTIYYGGDQSWYTDPSKRDNGCEPTAAANIMYYLDDKNPTKYGELYKYANASRDAFVRQMDIMYSYIEPGAFGETSLDDFIADVKLYAKDWNVTLTSYKLGQATLDTTANFIKAGLSKDTPVACLNLEPPIYGYDYAWHWMTITKYYRDVTTDNRWIAVSTWGQRHSIDFKRYHDSIEYYDGGFTYFE